jgi:hypothetical protein
LRIEGKLCKSYAWSRHHDLENGICDCVTMAKIVLGKGGADRELVFAVAHVSEMLSAFKASYHAVWHGEKQRDAAS